jgi:pimeloyl-ACP methyl ester carboxylesterase
LAPDLIGFGQSEKPALSYTGYMWDSQMMDFAKEVAVHRNRWTSYVTGGNSIGGFTSLSMAACDTATTTGREVTSSGSPGTGRCTGLVLMNSAGPVLTREEVVELGTVAQATALQALPPCKPPPRPVARAFGNILLGYQRPQIQSICKNLHPTNPAAVDEALAKEIERDSLDPGAVNVMMAGAKLPPPRTANQLLGADFGATPLPAQAGKEEAQIKESYFDGPVLILQGVLDPLNNATDRMYRYRALRAGIDIDPIQAGHCPHDELPDQIAKTWHRGCPTDLPRRR